MAIKVFADGANLEGMLDMYENGNVQGFTTNPSLMKKGGVTDYRAFAKEVLAHITDVSVSFEVFADDVETMEVEAREIATWAAWAMRAPLALAIRATTWVCSPPWRRLLPWATPCPRSRPSPTT